MAFVIERLRREAERIFLGHGSIIGVGMGGDDQHPELVFFLSAKSNETIDSVQVWASENHIAIRFVVTGKINALSKV